MDSPTSRPAFLSMLPHRIPFRAASAVHHQSEGTIEGVFVATANDPLPPEVMAVEALAQFGGALVLDGQGMLTGIEGCELLRAITPGDRLVCRVTLEAAFGGTYRFYGVGVVDGVEAVRARFYLAKSTADAAS